MNCRYISFPLYKRFLRNLTHSEFRHDCDSSLVKFPKHFVNICGFNEMLKAFNLTEPRFLSFVQTKDLCSRYFYLFLMRYMCNIYVFDMTKYQNTIYYTHKTMHFNFTYTLCLDLGLCSDLIETSICTQQRTTKSKFQISTHWVKAGTGQKVENTTFVDFKRWGWDKIRTHTMLDLLLPNQCKGLIWSTYPWL